MNNTEKASPPRWLVAAVLLLAILGTVGAVFSGPALGDHEALVAECAREMRLSGDWIVPRFVDTPFIRKPPLPYWLIAGASYLFPNDPATGLPVTATVARLPSALAGLGTVLLLWLLALKMFGRGAGIVAGLIAGSCIFTLLYSPNATVEMLLTFCCTWAVTHFWFAINARSGGKRFAHMMLFYVALGIGMLAKGPAPLAMVAVPIAFWWFTERPQRVLARGVATHAGHAVWLAFRDLKDRLIHIFTRLWLIPGIIVFLAIFVPWLFAVAERHPFAWDIWNWQYLQRFEGDYEDTRVRGVLYYVPILLGLLAPWTIALFEGVVAPWIRRYALQRRGLYFAGCWAVVGTLVMSLMEFKKPYYILPALPGFVLLISPVVAGFTRRIAAWRRATPMVMALGVVVLVTIVGVAVYLHREWPHVSSSVDYLPFAILSLTIVIAMALHVRRAILAGLVVIGFGLNGAFVTGWYAFGPSLDSIERTATLDEELDEAGVPENATVHFADQRPDARLRFYFRRLGEHMVNPSEIVSESVVREAGADWLQKMAIARAEQLLGGDEAVYLVMDREHLPMLDLLPAAVRERAYMLTTIDADGEPDDDDWIVVTNRKQQATRGWLTPPEGKARRFMLVRSDTHAFMPSP